MKFQVKNRYSALPVFFIATLAIEIITPLIATAQIIPDNTLGAESSLITPTNNLPQLAAPPPTDVVFPSDLPPQIPNFSSNIPADLQQFLIKGGAIRDSNLFHSFLEFNINNGQQINFANPEGIANILTRVTGNNPSTIFGALGVNGDANLFLINPNGIVFGENASININGSFVASTADKINFANNQSFSAIDPEAPPLLTIDIPLGVQFGTNPQAIAARQANIQAQDVTLLAGNLNLQQTTINAPGGKVYLGSLADEGIVNFNAKLPMDIARGDITIGDRSLINVISEGNGGITLEAQNITLANSNFQGGIDVDSGQTNSVAGNIYLDATNNILLENSEINHNLELNSLGNGGTVEIQAINLKLDNSRISSETRSQGNAGNIIVNVTDKLEVISPPENFDLDRSRNVNPRKGLFSTVTPDGRGNGGNIEVTTSEVSLSGLGGIDSSTAGIGHAGNINIHSDRVLVKEGAVISANGRGEGDGGEIYINATEFIELSDRQNTNSRPGAAPNPGGIIGDVGIDALSNGGNITLETGRLTVDSGAFIAAGTKGFGNAGNINIKATELVEVNSRNTSRTSSQIVSAVRREATGNGGKIEITTKNLSLRDGGRINVATENVGNAGNLSIIATENIELTGTSIEGIPSTISAQVIRRATGKGGNISVTAENINIEDGGQISASTLSLGKGGSVNIVANNTITISGFTNITEQTDNFRFSTLIKNNAETLFPSGIFASSPGFGNADALTINAENLTLSDQAQLSVSSQQQGAAGNLSINADQIQLENSILSAETIEGDRANIYLSAPDIRLRNQSLITTNATQTATGGDIGINAETLLALENSDITANAEDNFGGRVVIEAKAVFGTQVRDFNTDQSDITATSELGAEFNGVIEIDLTNTDPVSGIIQLPENFLDFAIAPSCNRDRENSFVVTGRGGLPSTPQEFFRGQTVLQDWRYSVISEQSSVNSEQPLSNSNVGAQGLRPSLRPSRDRAKIIEAQSWIVNPDGFVELVADYLPVNRDHLQKAMKCKN
ncbi:MAG: S-layer family protein [Cyanobacteria bacterium P01_F01_bin.143]